MDSFRKGFDYGYDILKPLIFKLTEHDPEEAHKLFVNVCNKLHKFNLEKLILDNKSNEKKLKISNAAGLNKNGEIPLTVLKYLGFDRAVIGTVTCDKWDGNFRPRTVRYKETGSMVNWMDLPGIGAYEIYNKLIDYKCHEVPLTINFMATPNKKGNEALEDLEETILLLRNAPYVDRFELNISCPNTEHSREEYQKNMADMLDTVRGKLLSNQRLYIKISPDLNENEVNETLDVINDYKIAGLTLTNTTTKHNPKYITNSPRRGGASGNAVYEESLRVQKLFYERTNLDIIACGGINSVEKMKERLIFGAKEIQIYTPIIFSGTKLIRELRNFK